MYCIVFILDAIVNKRWTFNEISDLLEKQIAILPGLKFINALYIVFNRTT